MTPIELKQWQMGLGLSETAMAAYIGVPVHTYRGWIKGTRKPDAAPIRLMHLLQMIEKRAPVLHLELTREARTAAPDRAPAKRGRPARGIVAPEPENAPESPESADLAIPEWMRIAA